MWAGTEKPILEHHRLNSNGTNESAQDKLNSSCPLVKNVEICKICGTWHLQLLIITPKNVCFLDQKAIDLMTIVEMPSCQFLR